MKLPYEEFDLSGVKTYPLRSRASKVTRAQFATPYKKGTGVDGFLEGLPSLLAVSDFRAVVQALLAARRAGRAIIWGLGAHVLKTGLSPVIVDLMERGFVSAVATNGAGAGSFSLRMGDHKDDQHDALADRNASTLPSATSPSATSRSVSPTWMARRAQCYAERVAEATERDAQTIFALSTSSAATGELAALAAATSAATSAAAAEAADERAAIVAAERELSMFQPLMTADDR